MCGLAGIMGPGINSWDLDIIRDLLTVSTLRGTDSTGVLQGKSESWFGGSRVDYVIEKSASDALYFKWFHSRAQDGNRRILNSAMDNFIACHVRHGTKGAISDENAHPFEFENIIGMHNGTLRDHKYDDKEKTDSELLLKDIDQRGIANVLREVDPWGAYALVVFDKNTGEFSFVRNDQRPLYYAVHDSRAVLYWASEAWMLREMMARNTEKMYKEVFYFKPHIIYSVHPQDIKAKKPMPFEQEEYKPRTLQTNHQGKGRFQQQQMLLAPPQVSVLHHTPRKTPGVKITNHERLTINSKTKIPTVYCCGCQKKMNLVDVFYATKLNNTGTTVICNECDNDYSQVFKSGKDEVIIN